MDFNPANLIAALDFEDPWKAQKIAYLLAPTGCSFKLGMEVVTGAAYSLLKAHNIVPAGQSTMRDGKYADIQSTVVKAIAQDSRHLGPRLSTVFIPGNHLAFREAVLWGKVNDPNLILLAVAALTSYTDEDIIKAFGGRFKTATDALVFFAKLALEMAEGHPIGLVCSPKDLPRLAAEGLLAKLAAIVTPGIRPAGAALGDQKRVGTPVSALQAGATHLVIGRPITEAPDPVAATQAILADIAAA